MKQSSPAFALTYPIILGCTLVAVTVALLFSLQTILLPFIVSALLGYLLDPVADKLEARNFSRGLATTITLAGFVILFLCFAMLIVPLLQDQLEQLIRTLPKSLAKLQELFHQLHSKWNEHFDINLTQLTSNWQQYGEHIAKTSIKLISQIVASGAAAFHLASLLFITPVVSFYLLRDWDRMTAAIATLIPLRVRDDAGTLAQDIDRSIAGYLRGQTMICLCFAGFYTTSFWLIGIDYSLLLGLIAGLLAFVPYVGLLIAMSLTLLIAYSGGGDWIILALCGGVFLTAQLLESLFLSPKIMGDATGLHPVWIIFGLMAWGLWLGFVGVLIAVPATAAMGAIIRFFIAKYQASDFYNAKAPKRK